MIKNKYIEPFSTEEGKRSVILSYGLKPEWIVEYLQGLTDAEITELGNALVWVYPPEILKAFIENEKDTKYYDFVEDFRKEYGIPSECSVEDKHMGIKIFRNIEQEHRKQY